MKEKNKITIKAELFTKTDDHNICLKILTVDGIEVERQTPMLTWVELKKPLTKPVIKE